MTDTNIKEREQTEASRRIDQIRSSERRRPRIPLATLCVLAVTGVMTGMQFVFPQVLPALERTPTALADHQWWRLMSPLLVHSDGWRQIAFNFPAILVVGFFFESIYGSKPLLPVYLVCGIAGEICGYMWQPHGAGASIAGAGLLGAVAFWLVGRNPTIQAKFGGVGILAGGLALAFIHNIHGPPVLLGACLGSVLPVILEPHSGPHRGRRRQP